MDHSHLNPPSFSTYLDQLQSPLFSVLPAEVRSEIFAFALTDFEDLSVPYSKETCYRRPGYDAPRRTRTELLRTCKRVFQEAWFMPFAYAEHALYLTSPDRAPRRHITVERMQRYLDILHASRREDVKINHARIFAQLWALEPGDRLQRVLNMQHFYPRRITITLRYTDFWYWEANEPLRVAAKWVNICRFPNSLTRLSIDFESIERRKEEVNYIAKEAAERWHFRRQDGTVLSACQAETSIMKWTGSSIWGGQRWIRDEVRPNELDYHAVTVTWRPAPSDGDVPEECPDLSVPRTFPRPPVPNPNRGEAWLELDDLRAANVPPDATADEAYAAIVELHRQRQRARRVR
ncbi:hypothetical protein VTN96DRAFT_5591 [Rasamsonia emersonii]|uniref:Uncharacterized protein n=1 Tax=Rasamsonia emersonii (strain ATCC 16479 / CBS 393.64 / IMI 116815) TaxID=1408163 RepID=A0A0F4YDH8_RASE3|nr:hypothetical protein T310_10127 [Rasamsonia emersonii CBS 393.64]KKA16272.1 hypothetical protein T310_10127 [Rasamsonia emersonii CBS 393.64]